MRRRKPFQRLDYREEIIDGVPFQIAYSNVKEMYINCKDDGNIYAVCNYRDDKEEFFKFLKDNVEWAKENSKKMVASKNDIFNKKLTKEQVKILRNKISDLINKYVPLIGVELKKWSLYDMYTMWGRCTYDDKTIRFSKMLYFCKDEFIEYIVIHELIHLKNPNHNKRFWATVKKYISNYKEIKKMYD